MGFALSPAGGSREPLQLPSSPALSVERHAGTAVLFVDDNGPGVPAPDRKRIFDPYVTHREGGTGLGLAIVRKIVIDHGGDVTVESAPPPLGGARLVVQIPSGS